MCPIKYLQMTIVLKLYRYCCYTRSPACNKKQFYAKLLLNHHCPQLNLVLYWLIEYCHLCTTISTWPLVKHEWTFEGLYISIYNGSVIQLTIKKGFWKGMQALRFDVL